MLPSDLLIQIKWFQGTRTAEDATCLVSAIYRRVSEQQERVQLLEALRRLLNLEDTCQALTNWNDHTCPDKATAVAVLRQAEINCGLRPVEDDTIEQPEVAYVTV